MRSPSKMHTTSISSPRDPDLRYGTGGRVGRGAVCPVGPENGRGFSPRPNHPTFFFTIDAGSPSLDPSPAGQTLFDGQDDGAGEGKKGMRLAKPLPLPRPRDFVRNGTTQWEKVRIKSGRIGIGIGKSEYRNSKQIRMTETQNRSPSVRPTPLEKKRLDVHVKDNVTGHPFIQNAAWRDAAPYLCALSMQRLVGTTHPTVYMIVEN